MDSNCNNSRAASSIAGGNALSGGLNSISNYYQTQNLLSQLKGAQIPLGGYMPSNAVNLAGAFNP